MDNYLDKVLRPFFLLLFNTLPLILEKNPCFFFIFLLLGWKVLFIWFILSKRLMRFLNRYLHNIAWFPHNANLFSGFRRIMRSNTAGAEGHGDPWGSTVKDGIDQRSVFGFRRDRKKDESGNLSAATRRTVLHKITAAHFGWLAKKAIAASSRRLPAG